MRGALLAVAGAFALIAATPEPRPTPVDLIKVQPKALLPKKKLHSEFIVDINKLGQVTHVHPSKSSGDRTFDTQTFGNAQQAFIRKPDGTAVVGSYRMVYDFTPATGKVRREALLVKRGGVDPNAKGAALEMEAIARRHTPEPAATTRSDGRTTLPDLPLIIPSPTR